MNQNITDNGSWYAQNIDPELDAKLDEFDRIIKDTFGAEVEFIRHSLWSERVSFTTVKFTDGGFIGFRVSPRKVVDDTYQLNPADRLRRAFNAFGIELPFWMLSRSA